MMNKEIFSMFTIPNGIFFLDFLFLFYNDDLIVRRNTFKCNKVVVRQGKFHCNMSWGQCERIL